MTFLIVGGIFTFIAYVILLVIAINSAATMETEEHN